MTFHFKKRRHAPFSLTFSCKTKKKVFPRSSHQAITTTSHLPHPSEAPPHRRRRGSTSHKKSGAPEARHISLSQKATRDYLFFSKSLISWSSLTSSGTTGSAGAGAGSAGFSLAAFTLLIPLTTMKIEKAMMMKSKMTCRRLP